MSGSGFESSCSLLNECLPKVKGRSLNAKSQSSNSFNENLIQKWVNNSKFSLIQNDSDISESSVISSHLSGSNNQFQNFQYIIAHQGPITKK